MTENTPSPFNPYAVAYARTALDAAVNNDAATVADTIRLLLAEHGMPGAYDAIFTWCAAIRAHLRVPLGTNVAVVYVNDDGETVQPPEARPAYVWANRVMQAYIAHDKPSLNAVVAEMGDDPKQVKAHLGQLVAHAAEVAWAAARRAELS
ncbi:hypothetical protein [Nonomuraea wenchangensis]|uniref:Uncharacterized protein n=1 Tax=Nonomuraea wenchangensis TaxID=568860 RepID=A0A1I0LV13_9ACTN|nr:hypothetical protein [Nonomuraea wenchangensis]SEU46430.1 hypothetical protein SAMN05421811_12732 [Nonomuraea wenchangensis]